MRTTVAISLLAIAAAVASVVRADHATDAGNTVDAFFTICMNAAPDFSAGLEKLAVEGHWQESDDELLSRPPSSRAWLTTWEGLDLIVGYTDGKDQSSGACLVAAANVPVEAVDAVLRERLGALPSRESVHPLPAKMWKAVANGLSVEVALFTFASGIGYDDVQERAQLMVIYPPAPPPQGNSAP